MELSNLKAGSRVFIDANIFVYHFTGLSQECRQFLSRCEQGVLQGVTAITVLLEVCHRLMTIEAVEKKITSSRQPSRYLKKHPHLVKNLTRYYSYTADISLWGIQILLPPWDILQKSQYYRNTYGLLTNDSLIPVYMQTAGISHLASADQAMDKIRHITLCLPQDIQS